MEDAMKKTVLVVDDEEEIIFYLKTLLEDEGINVLTASNGVEALEQVKKHKPDFISLDLIMPKKSGIRFYYELRKNKEWSKIPVIIVSGHAEDEEVKRDMKETFAGKTISGPSVYLEKPVNPKVFINMVKKQLGLEADENGYEESQKLRDEAQDMLKGMDAGELKDVLEALKKKKE